MIHFEKLIPIVEEIPMEDYRVSLRDKIENLTRLLAEKDVTGFRTIQPIDTPSQWTRDSALDSLSEKREEIATLQESRQIYEKGRLLREYFGIFHSLGEMDMTRSLFDEYIELVSNETRSSLQAALSGEMAGDCIDLGYDEYAEICISHLEKILEDHPHTRWPEEYGSVKLYRELARDLRARLSGEEVAPETFEFSEKDAQAFLDATVDMILEIPSDEWIVRHKIIIALIEQIRLAKLGYMSSADLGIDRRAIGV